MRWQILINFDHDKQQLMYSHFILHLFSCLPTFLQNQCKLYFDLSLFTFSFWFSSSARYFSASASILSISSLDSLPLSFWIVILSDFPVLPSLAETLRIPLASKSKVTSIFGTPRGAGGIPVKLNVPSKLLSRVIARSPSNTCKWGYNIMFC